MRHYAVVELDITDPGWVAEYVAAVTPLVEARVAVTSHAPHESAAPPDVRASAALHPAHRVRGADWSRPRQPGWTSRPRANALARAPGRQTPQPQRARTRR